MPTLTLTAKRQATFPAETCRALGVRPGDQLNLEPMNIDGRKVWVIEARPQRVRAWIGALSRYGARQTDHSMQAVRESIARGRARKGSK